MNTEQENRENIAILIRDISHLNDGLGEVRAAISKSTAWLVTTLVTFLIGSFSLAFWMGSWKGQIEQRIENLTAQSQMNHSDLRQLSDIIRGRYNQ